MTAVFIGIDVACAKEKRLPVCFARWVEHRLEPLVLPKSMARLIPCGPGNGAVRNPLPFVELAARTVTAIQAVCENSGHRIERVATDAPAAPGSVGRRRCEAALNEAGLSVFKTPRGDEWPWILATCRAHLDGGGRIARVPYANKIWMLYGFELFSALRRAGFGVIEVYPFAIARDLLPEHPHKSTAEGYGLQLRAIAGQTGWSPTELEPRLREAVGGSRQDRLDAFMATWVASLPSGARETYGDPNDDADAIWVPITNRANRL